VQVQQHQIDSAAAKRALPPRPWSAQPRATENPATRSTYADAPGRDRLVLDDQNVDHRDPERPVR
jgi:hypothetical protein